MAPLRKTPVARAHARDHQQRVRQTIGPALRRETALAERICVVYVRSSETGLTVKATLMRGDYPTGIKIVDSKMAVVRLRAHKVLPEWNYTLVPRRAHT